MPRALLEMELLRSPQSGIGQFCSHLASEFRAMATASWDLTYLTSARGRAHLAPDQKWQPQERYLRMKWLPFLYPFFRVWHCTNQTSMFLPTSRKTRFVLTIHDLNFLGEETATAAESRALLCDLAAKARRAAVVAVDTDFVRREILEHLDIPEARVRVIPLGVWAARDSAVSRPAFLAADEPFLFTIGFVEAKKNFHVLVRLLPDLTGQRLVIAGANHKTYARQIMAHARELGVADRVIMPGSIPEAEKQWLYAHCSAFVFPSLLEGFGLPVLEAMAHGKPVFISDKGPLPEVGGSDAFVWTDFSREALVETFQRGMREFHGDPQRPERHRAHAATFTWRRTAEAYLSAYREASG